MADLARGKPGIHVRELAGLLDLDVDTAIELARRAQAKSNVSIAFEVESSH